MEGGRDLFWFFFYFFQLFFSIKIFLMWTSLSILWHCLSLGLEWKLTFSSSRPFSVLSFPNLLVYWVKHFHSIISRIRNSSIGIPSILWIENGSFIIQCFQVLRKSDGARWLLFLGRAWESGLISPIMSSSFFSRKYVCNLEEVSYQNAFSLVLTLKDKG